MLLSAKICRNCVINKMLLTHDRFLSKNNVSLNNESTLVILTNSIKSLALFHLMKSKLCCSQEITCHKIYFLYIDETVTSEDAVPIYEPNILRIIREESKQFHLQTYCTSLDDYFVSERILLCSVYSYMVQSLKNSTLFQIFLKKIQDPSVKLCFYRSLIIKVSVFVAKLLKCDIILYYDLHSDSASSLLNNLVLGQAVNNFKVCIPWLKNVSIKLCYPLHCFTIRDIITYLKCISFLDFKHDKLSPINNCKKALQRFTKNFLCSLQNDSKLTISNICKFSSKLDKYCVTSLLTRYCILCNHLNSLVVQETNFSQDLMITNCVEKKTNNLDYFHICSLELSPNYPILLPKSNTLSLDLKKIGICQSCFIAYKHRNYS
ncbi:uncharacterized protein LOC106637929 [Copidosoma floridanum]|uniref:uncharacterized protein LOC106637929 n=1 Tax=Copidosoma floridanum TaxID=29053 RepID=UPI0006C999A2|nr:uncharacterized protein LOC106637929 [Copidosoma floridanum]